jgi:hypothetical protein
VRRKSPETSNLFRAIEKMNPFEQLKQNFYDAASSNPSVQKYVAGRLDKDGKYTGWVGPVASSSGPSLQLNLSLENDQFLLYCLASAWSATGPWENAATLIYTIKNFAYERASPHAWLDEAEFSESCRITKATFELNKDIFSPRKSAVIRKDIFRAFHRIASQWEQIKRLMAAAEESSNWENFVRELRCINGLAPGVTETKRLLIKIPLILRELRCQKVFMNIPGDLCCVPDARVIDAIKVLQKSPDFERSSGLKSYRPSSAETLITSSRAIYKVFGDLYDLPLFAAEDIDPSIKMLRD